MTQKSDETEDLRVRRTRKMLQEALMQLTAEKGFDAVTVRDITERAMVNRSTFYRHYLDKYDLIDQYLDEVYALALEEDKLGEEQARATRTEIPSGLVTMLRHVQKFADFYRVMLGQNGCARFTERFRQHSEQRFRMLLDQFGAEPEPDSPPVDLRLQYISCAGVGTILWWLESGQPCTPEQLAVWLAKLNTTSARLSLKIVAS